MKPNTIEISGKTYETKEHLQSRLHVSDYVIEKLLAEGLSKPIKLGRSTYFDRDGVDAFLTR
jgi:hypothetical protein